MHRVALRALAACASLFALSTTLSAAPLALDSRVYAHVAPTVPAPEPAVADAEPAPVHLVGNMGGGFIEFLFSGGDRQESYQAQPAYPPQARYPVQPQYAPQPRYAPQPEYAPQPQYAVQPQSAPPAPALQFPFAALFSPQPQHPSQPEQARYEAEPEDAGYRDPYLQRPGYPEPRANAANFQIDPRYLKQTVAYHGNESAGTIIIDTPNKFLYLVQGNGTAIRYGVGVGRPGFTWAGIKHVSLKREWPDWTPPPEMLRRQPDLPRHMAGGPRNPLGARALYLGSSLYRIHGSNEPWTIGTNVSSGCIRMRNEDVVDLYERVKVGTKVVVM